MVLHDLLLERLMESTHPSNVLWWLSSYLHGRSAACQYQRARSGFRAVRAHKALSSPFASSISLLLTTSTQQISIAPTQMTSPLSFLTTMSTPPLSACLSNPLTLSTGLQITAFRPPSIKATVPYSLQTHTSLGTTHKCLPMATPSRSAGHSRFWESLSTPISPFPPHIREVADWARSLLGILKALARVSWGQSKEVFLLTYQMLIKSILTFAAPDVVP